MKITTEIRYMRNDGTSNVIVRISHKGVRKYIPTPIYVTQSDLTKDKQIKSLSIKRDVNRFVLDLQDKILAISSEVERMNVEELVNYLTKNEDRYIDFLSYGRKIIQKYIKRGKDKTAKGIQTALNNFEKYCGTSRFNINDLTTNYMRRYQESLEHTVRAKTLYPAFLRIVLNHAKDEFNDDEKGIMLIRVSPFTTNTGKAKISTKYVSRGQRALTLGEFKAVKDCKEITYMYKTKHRTTGEMITSPTVVPIGKTGRTQLAQDLFMLSFYLIGMNEVDLFNVTSYKDNIISYKRSKTTDRRDDEAYFEVRVEPEALPLIRKYRDKTGKRVFNFYQTYNSVQALTQAVNKGLKYIKADLTFYQARHTWATLAVNEVGIDKQLVHEALNHVDEKMKITDKYVIKKFDLYWDANRKVLDYIRK